MSHTPVGGHPQGWEHKLADRSSLPPAPGEERTKSLARHVFTQPHLPKGAGGVGGGVMAWREETEGSSASSARSPASSPPYLRWARTLHDLLEDAEGVRLFRKFVSGAGKIHTDRLDFYFAVLGLRQESEQAQIRQTVSVIYKFLRKSQLAMPEALRAQVKQALRDGDRIDPTIFDNMEQEVTRSITESTYQAFLRSEAYVSYVSAATQPLSSPDASPPPQPPHNKEASVGVLATLHEGEELTPGAPPAPPARLTHDALLATQSRRLHSDTTAGTFGRKRSVYSSAHLTYAGYCPASRQDSERASLSSGRTDSDAVSLSGSSLDGMSVRGIREVRERHRPRAQHLDRHPINKDTDTNMVIPRTQRVQSETLRVLPPAEFAPLLIERLERVKRDQDNKERLERRLAEGDGEDASTQALPPQLVAAAIREKLQLDTDNDQDILDQHVSRVWSERTPGASPPGGRRPRDPRRRRPPSTLSADSGLSGHYDAHSDLSLPHMGPRRSFPKKSATELTDSGVSVVSERTSTSAGGGGGCGGAEGRVLLWADRGGERARSRPGYLSSRASSADRDEPRRSGKQAQTRTRGASGSKSSGSGTSNASEPACCTVVVVTFLDETMPYRIKVPAAPLTLKTFKDYLPRKGNYRYFFKTECADLDNTVIQEEVTGDHEVLPMFDGKVMARVKSIE